MHGPIIRRMHNHDGDLRDYRAENGFALLSENEAIGVIALLLLFAVIADRCGWFL